MPFLSLRMTFVISRVDVWENFWNFIIKITSELNCIVDDVIAQSCKNIIKVGVQSTSNWPCLTHNDAIESNSGLL